MRVSVLLALFSTIIIAAAQSITPTPTPTPTACYVYNPRCTICPAPLQTNSAQARLCPPAAFSSASVAFASGSVPVTSVAPTTTNTQVTTPSTSASSTQIGSKNSASLLAIPGCTFGVASIIVAVVSGPVILLL
ncbi:hypothetical protein FRB99_006942 [Tulasnella sp. 403]|nr:hypothetical protein FRB99_006942 [Tulasnella sp. 403]